MDPEYVFPRPNGGLRTSGEMPVRSASHQQENHGIRRGTTDRRVAAVNPAVQDAWDDLKAVDTTGGLNFELQRIVLPLDVCVWPYTTWTLVIVPSTTHARESRH
jgi:hypothetical protein